MYDPSDDLLREKGLLEQVIYQVYIRPARWLHRRGQDRKTRLRIHLAAVIILFIGFIAMLFSGWFFMIWPLLALLFYFDLILATASHFGHPSGKWRRYWDWVDSQ